MIAARIMKAPRVLGSLAMRLSRQEGGRDTVHYLHEIGLSYQAARDVTKAIKVAASPIKAMRRWPARTNEAVSAFPRVPTTTGWLTVPEGTLTGAKELAAHCAAVFERKKSAIMASFRPPYGFAMTYKSIGPQVEMEDVEDFRPVVQFSAQQSLFDMLTDYIGEYPVLSNVSLLYTMPESGRVGPQLFHRDTHERRMLHLVMPVWPVDMESGPFTFLPADRSADVVAAINHTQGRIQDEVMYQHITDDELIRCTGEPGTVYLVNPYDCIHFGARTKSKPRLLLILNYTSAFEAAEGQMACYRSSNRKQLDDGSRNVRFLLNL